MSVSKGVLLAVGCSFVIGLSTGGMAQTANKSTEAAAMGESEAIIVHPQGVVHKSKSKVTAAEHEAAMKNGAREVTSGTVLYRRGGKLYIVEDSRTQKASELFPDHFDQPYQGGPKASD